MAEKQEANDYDWRDTNLALFGSDLDKGVKKEAAETEPAWKPVRSVTASTLFVWRIEKFKVVPVRKNEYGSFYNGDSYIVLNAEKVGNVFSYDVHFWIGRESTQDEYGTAAYKTVELDAFLDDKAIQHREVEGCESELFKSYFPTMRILSGGVETGFVHVKPNEYRPRLLHLRVAVRKMLELYEVTLSKNSLDSGDVFILDLGDRAIQWNGKQSNKEERFLAARFLQELEGERNGKCKTWVVDEDTTSPSDEFMQHLPDVPVKQNPKLEEAGKSLYRLSDATGKMTFELISKGLVPKSSVCQNDVYFIDTCQELFVYVGEGCSVNERKNAMSYAHNYLKESTHPYIPVTVVGAGQRSRTLDRLWD